MHPARLSCRQGRALLDEHTVMRGLGTGWDLRGYGQAEPTRLGAQGAFLPMLMAKSRHGTLPGRRRGNLVAAAGRS
ncbi:hypothetical protein [Streptomyces sp. NPDC001222]|uniref:hypothetical protein n=1 Tax=Streptomyces sp. NPDC001222 TaxID=3364548 RepID=UPI0036AAB80C